MRWALTVIGAVLALVPGTASAQSAYELPFCGGVVIGGLPLPSGGVHHSSGLCHGATSAELVEAPAHGTATVRVTQTQAPMTGETLPMLELRYESAPGTPAGTRDSLRYRAHIGDRVTGTVTVRFRIVPGGAPFVTFLPGEPPRLRASATLRKGKVRVRASCDVACAVRAAVDRGGSVEAPAAGDLTLPVPRRALRRKGALTVTVTAIAAGGGTATRLIVLRR